MFPFRNNRQNGTLQVKQKTAQLIRPKTFTESADKEWEAKYNKDSAEQRENPFLGFRAGAFKLPFI